jgi:hypothetical protein
MAIYCLVNHFLHFGRSQGILLSSTRINWALLMVFIIGCLNYIFIGFFQTGFKYLIISLVFNILFLLIGFVLTEKLQDKLEDPFVYLIACYALGIGLFSLSNYIFLHFHTRHFTIVSNYLIFSVVVVSTFINFMRFPKLISTFQEGMLRYFL